MSPSFHHNKNSLSLFILHRLTAAHCAVVIIWFIIFINTAIAQVTPSGMDQSRDLIMTTSTTTPSSAATNTDWPGFEPASDTTEDALDSSSSSSTETSMAVHSGSGGGGVAVRKCRRNDIGCLIEERMRSYDKHVLPQSDDGGAVEVTVDVSIRSMGPISEYDMTFSMNCYFRQMWNDKRLKFDVNVTKWITLSIKFLERVWLPDTSFINGKRSYHHDITTPNRFIRIKPADGSLYYSTRLTIKASCPMNLVTYPMDEQSCPLVIGSFAYPSHLVTYRWLRPNDAPVAYADDRNRLGLSQFWIINVEGTNYTDRMWHDTHSVLVVNFHLRRHVGYYMIQVYTPCSLCVVLSWVGFWINREATADRVTLGVTTVLTLTFLNFETRQEAPRVSYPTAIDWFVNICFAFVLFSIVEFALVHFHTKYGTGEYPDAIREVPDSYDTVDRRERFWRRVTQRQRRKSLGLNLRRRMSRAIGLRSVGEGDIAGYSGDNDDDDSLPVLAALPHPLPSPAELPPTITIATDDDDSPTHLVNTLMNAHTAHAAARNSYIDNNGLDVVVLAVDSAARYYEQDDIPAITRSSSASTFARRFSRRLTLRGSRLDRRRSSPRPMSQYSAWQKMWDFCCGMHAWQRYRHKYERNLQHGRINSVSRLDITSRLAFPLFYVGFLIVYFMYFNYFHQLFADGGTG